MSKFSEMVFNKIDNAKIDEVKEIEFKTECISDVIDILTELVKYRYMGGDEQLRDYNDIDFAASKIIYDYEKGKYYIDFE